MLNVEAVFYAALVVLALGCFVAGWVLGYLRARRLRGDVPFEGDIVTLWPPVADCTVQVPVSMVGVTKEME